MYAFHADTGLETSYDSVATLFATTLELWRTGALPQEDNAYLPEGLREIRARLNPLSRDPDGTPRQEISRWSSRDWPKAWKDVVGLPATAAAPADQLVTIADFLSGSTSGHPIRGRLRVLAGSSEELVATVTDESGSLEVLLTRDDTEGFREVRGEGVFELWLVPVVDRPLQYLATRVVPA